MLTIFHASPTRSFRIVWMAEEMGLPYMLKPETLGRWSAELTAVNPLNTLPTVRDGDRILTESASTLQYLGETYGPTPLVPARGDTNYWAFTEALHYGESSLAAYLTPLVATRFMAPAEHRENFTATLLTNMFVGRLGYADRRLAEGPYITGDTFTAADICIGYALRFGEFFDLASRYPATVAAYFDRLKARPAYQKALAA